MSVVQHRKQHQSNSIRIGSSFGIPTTIQLLTLDNSAPPCNVIVARGFVYYVHIDFSDKKRVGGGM
jgi:hypothetical protein